jgi:exocyst complex protein 7
MKRVEKALVDLNATNLRSNQTAIADFNSLLSTASTKLQEMLRSELKQNLAPIEPLHYLTKGMVVIQCLARSRRN